MYFDFDCVTVKDTTDLVKFNFFAMPRSLVVQPRAVLAVLIGDILVVRRINPDEIEAVAWIVWGVVVTKLLDDVYQQLASSPF